MRLLSQKSIEREDIRFEGERIRVNEGLFTLMKGESKINHRKKINTTFNTEDIIKFM